MLTRSLILALALVAALAEAALGQEGKETTGQILSTEQQIALLLAQREACAQLKDLVEDLTRKADRVDEHGAKLSRQTSETAQLLADVYLDHASELYRVGRGDLENIRRTLLCFVPQELWRTPR